jgi:predicted secreted protein
MIILVIFLLISCSKGTDATIKQRVTDDKNNETRYIKEMDELKKTLKSEVKIKLKKDGKGGYSWEIAGKDAQEILKVNDILRKKLNE